MSHSLGKPDCLLAGMSPSASGKSSPTGVAVSLGNLTPQLRAGFLLLMLVALPVAFPLMRDDALVLLPPHLVSLGNHSGRADDREAENSAGHRYQRRSRRRPRQLVPILPARQLKLAQD